jgi:hypothetical protein
MTSQADPAKTVDLHAIIQARLAAGDLPPPANGQRSYAGYGEDQVCDGCGRPIGRADVGYDIEFPSIVLPTLTLSMHVGCFAVWVAVSGSADQPSAPGSWR